MAEPTTAQRILDAAMTSFAARGYEATSLDALAGTLGVRKQTILYWFSTKEDLLDAAIDRTASELAAALERTLRQAGPGWARIEAVVRSVFRLAARRPELLGGVREVSRLGPPRSDRLTQALAPLMSRATEFVEAEMDAGRMRRQDPRLVLMAAYSAVVGVATEAEVLRALGFEPTLRSMVRRRAELLAMLRSALVEPEAAEKMG